MQMVMRFSAPWRMLPLAAWCALGVITTFPALGQTPSLTTFSAPTGLTFDRISRISGDGTTVVGQVRDNNAMPWTWSWQAFRWTSGGGLTLLPQFPEQSHSYAHGVSYDGSTIVGSATFPSGTMAVRWTPAGPAALWTGTADAVSADGGTLAGSTSPVGSYRWTAAGGFMNLGVLGVRDMSADGSVIVGNMNDGWRWTEQGGAQTLFLPPEWDHSSATGVSVDGRVVAGSLRRGVATPEFAAARWVDGGEPELLADLFPGASSFAYDVSADGSVIVGRTGGIPAGGATVWIHGEVYLVEDLLTSLGIDTLGLTLREAYSVSDDGRTIAGVATGDGFDVGWVATIPSPGVGAIGPLAILALFRRRARSRHPLSHAMCPHAKRPPAQR